MRAWTALSAGSTRSRRGVSPTTASIAARSAAVALGPTILRSIGSGSQPLDADRGGLELGRPGFRISGVDGENARRHVVGEMQCHEREARTQALVEPDGHLDGAATRSHTHDVALAQT